MITEDIPVIKVGMADMNAIQAPGVIKTSGLGSCIGLSLYDPVHKIGGLAHIMLPSSDIARDQSYHLAKFADTAIPALIEQMVKLGARKSCLQAKMAGGAQMFALASSEMMRIGPRNIERCKEMLNEYTIPLIAEDTGGSYGRTVELNCSNGVFVIRSVQNGVKQI